MNRYHKHVRKCALFALLFTAALSGCASVPGPASAITIDSDPQGAELIVSGRHVGTTPVHVVLDKVFPRHWTGRIKSDIGPGFAFYRRLAIVTVRKTGCKPYTRQLTGKNLRHDFTVTLRCGPQYLPQPPVPPQAAPAAAPLPATTVKQRLRELLDLKDEGLITDKEYHEQQERILDQL